MTKSRRYDGLMVLAAVCSLTALVFGVSTFFVASGARSDAQDAKEAAGASSAVASGDAALKLTPKAELPRIDAKEGDQYTYAPAVPAPIHRRGQARVVVHWDASEFQRTLDPDTGVEYAQWGFNGHTPGPVLRVRQGDLVELHLTNNLSAAHPHNIDFHFVTGPGGGAKALSVAPGETASIEARALTPGFLMYHCATADIPTHIANGMYGYVIVEPPEGLSRVDKEFYVVQSEFYPTTTGGVESLDLTKLDAEQPDYVVFNGAVGALTEANSPKARVGDVVRLWVGNAGPELTSSFHVIGEIFDRVYREGDLISQPGRGIQTTTIPSGGSTMVEFKVEVPGTYLLVDHAIARAIHKGAVGTLIVEGPEQPEIFAPGGVGAANGDGPGASSTTTTTTAAPAASAVQVRIPKGAYDPANAATAFGPATVHVKAGETVEWINGDIIVHTVTADDKSFDSGDIGKAKHWRRKFTKPGTYTYHCTPHPFMKGTVIVDP
ncbi:MAG: nitrite reductase, copper-containing [Acidimicrobiia bacterium]|nr:nitrite reductase, copper-containing [Acidimicrobiia bacterium]